MTLPPGKSQGTKLGFPAPAPTALTLHAMQASADPPSTRACSTTAPCSLPHSPLVPGAAAGHTALFPAPRGAWAAPSAQEALLSDLLFQFQHQHQALREGTCEPSLNQVPQVTPSQRPRSAEETIRLLFIVYSVKR